MNTAKPSDGASALAGARAASTSSSSSAIGDFMIYRLERALRERVRYRYVEPRVLREGESFRIQSPCCSRNIDPSGGLIDIALLTPGPVGATNDWSLSARDHAAGVWRACLSDAPLELLLDALCVDSERQFWP